MQRLRYNNRKTHVSFYADLFYRRQNIEPILGAVLFAKHIEYGQHVMIGTYTKAAPNESAATLHETPSRRLSPPLAANGERKKSAVSTQGA